MTPWLTNPQWSWIENMVSDCGVFIDRRKKSFFARLAEVDLNDAPRGGGH